VLLQFDQTHRRSAAFPASTLGLVSVLITGDGTCRNARPILFTVVFHNLLLSVLNGLSHIVHLHNKLSHCFETPTDRHLEAGDLPEWVMLASSEWTVLVGDWTSLRLM
jgi:hypothetical protein